MSSPPAPSADARRTALAVLALCAAMNLLARGVGETFNVFLLPLQAEFGWQRADLTGVYSVYMLVHGLAALGAGLLFDRMGPRQLYILGLALLGSGYLLAGRLGSLWQLYVCIGLLGGLGATAMGMVPASGLICRWFRARLASAMGLAYAGLGTGVLVIVPLAQWLIDRHGWRATYEGMGLTLLVLIVPVALLPWRRIAAGHPLLAAERRAGAADASGWTLRRALASRPFWGLFAVFFFTSFSIYLINPQFVAYLVDAGFPALQASLAFGVAGMLSVAGMIGTGWLADRFSRLWVVSVSYGLTFAGLGFLALLPGTPTAPLLVAFVLCFGLSMGARGPVVSTLAARLYPGGGFGAVYGAITLGMGLGAASGSKLSGVLHDLTGGYQANLGLSAAMLLAALAQFWLIPALASGRHPAPDDRRPSGAAGGA
jgi:MFS family permease